MNTLTATITIIIVLIIAFYALIRAYIVIEWLKEKLLLNPSLKKYNTYLLSITTITVFIIIANIDNSSSKQKTDSITSKNTITVPEKVEATTNEYTNGGDIIRLLGATSNSYDLYTSRELDKSDVQLLKNALTYMDLNKNYTSFLYLKGKHGEDYYASFNGMNIHPKVTKEVLNENLLSDLKLGMNISSKGDILLFLDKIEKAKKAINNNIANKEEFKKTLLSFQKIHFPKARKAYYQNAKEELWEKDIEVNMTGKNITFIGYHFSANKVIKDTYLEIKNELIKLRFKTVGFKAFDGDDKTYWELSSKSDLEI